MSCTGNGYLSGNMLIPFPFEDGETLSWDRLASEAQTSLQRCFVDAAVNIRGTIASDNEWPYISICSVDENGMVFGIHACGRTSFEMATPSDKAFPIIRYSDLWGSYIIVVSSEGIRDFMSFCISNSISPPAPGSSSPTGRGGGRFLRLCARCVNVAPQGVMSIRVFNGKDEKDSGPHFTLRGNVSVRPGNNMRFTRSDEDNSMTFNAIPGAGDGIVSCGCKDKTVVASPLMSPDGHVRLFNDTCYDLEPGPLFYKDINGRSTPTRELKIHAKCTACCTCKMYESIVNDRLAAIFDNVKTLKSNMDGMLNKYENGVRIFNSRISAPSMSDITMSLTGMPIGRNLSPNIAGSGVKGKMSRCAFSAVIRNSSYAIIRASVHSISGTNSVVEISASYSDEAGKPKSISVDSAQGIIGKTLVILPGRSAVITFISSKDAMSGNAQTGGYHGEISVGISYNTREGRSGSLGTLSKEIDV